MQAIVQNYTRIANFANIASNKVYLKNGKIILYKEFFGLFGQ